MRLAAAGILVVSLIAPAIARAQCVVRSAGALPRVRIEPAGAPAFELAIDDPNATEVIGSDAPRARVRGTRPLRFEGSIEVAGLALRPARSIVAASGVLSVDPAAELVASALGAREASVDLPLVGGTALGVRVPCRSLRLVSSEDRARHGPARGALPEGAPALVAVGPSLEVRARARGPVVLQIRVDDAALLRMAELRRQDEAVEILLTGYGTTAVRGWVDAGAVRAAEGPAPGEVGGLGGLGSGCGRGGSGYHYRGPATLVSGAEVRAAPDGPVWARATAPIEVTIAIVRAGGPVQIERVPGVRGLGGACASVLETAWVRTEDVRLPARAAR